MDLKVVEMDKIDKIIEENFCLKFELDTLAEVLLRNESERWVPGYLHSATEHSHIVRYELACKFSPGKEVIDIACGVGKGSFMLADMGDAIKVNGYDIQANTIRYAKWRNNHINIDFNIGNAEELSITEKFDLAISFETIEHLKGYKKFIKNIYNCLRADGIFIVSTPIASVPLDFNPANPYHVQEWGFSEFHKLLMNDFIIEEVHIQLYPFHTQLKSLGLPKRVFNKLMKIITRESGEKHSVTVPVSRKYPEIEKYESQYNEEDLGTVRFGYQILVAKKK